MAPGNSRLVVDPTRGGRIEEHLRLALDPERMGCWELDLASNVRHIDATEARLAGYPEDTREVAEDEFLSRVHPEDRARVLRRGAELKWCGGHFEDEFCIQLPDGQVRWLASRGRVICDPADVSVRITGIHWDITERKQIEERVRRDELRYRSLFENDLTGDFVANADGVITLCNPAFLAIFGFANVEEAIGTQLADLLCPAESWGDFTARLKQSRRLQRDGRSARRRDGTPLHIVQTVVGSYDAKGDLVELQGYVFDDTERSRALAALRESEARFRAVFELSSVGMVQCDLDSGRFIRANPRFCEVTGYSEAELRQRNFSDITHVDDRSADLQDCLRLVRGEIPTFRVENRYVRKDGAIVWGEASTNIVRDAEGWPAWFFAVVRDITDRKRLEEDLKAADRRKDEFIAMLAHELRNPLAPIRNVINRLERIGDLKPEVERGRQIISRQLDHFTRLINDLLDVSRVTRDKLELRRERVELVEIVNAALETSGLLIEERGHQLTIALAPEPIYLNADAIRLAQVFVNLLNNAAKYTPPGGRIGLTAERDGGQAVVRVADNGLGIAGEQLPYLFDMFYQADRSYQQTHGGLGIGLTLVQRLVAMHDGVIEAHSAGLNQGSEFIVRLPLLLDPVVAPNETAAPPMAATAATARRILVVDDYGDSADTLAELLELDGNEVRVAHDGLEALAAAQEFRPAMVLLDLGMPNLNGYETAKRLRQQSYGKQMILIAVTGWGEGDSVERTRAAGFNGHILKPVDYPALTALIDKLAN